MQFYEKSKDKRRLCGVNEIRNEWIEIKKKKPKKKRTQNLIRFKNGTIDQMQLNASPWQATPGQTNESDDTLVYNSTEFPNTWFEAVVCVCVCEHERKHEWVRKRMQKSHWEIATEAKKKMCKSNVERWEDTEKKRRSDCCTDDWTFCGITMKFPFDFISLWSLNKLLISVFFFFKIEIVSKNKNKIDFQCYRLLISTMIIKRSSREIYDCDDLFDLTSFRYFNFFWGLREDSDASHVDL